MTRAALFLVPIMAMSAAACVQDTADRDEPVLGVSSERQCFFLREVNGYSQAPDGQRGERIYVDTGPNERFLLETWGSCPELDWTVQLAIDPRFQSGSICSGENVTLIIPNSFASQGDRCTARVLGKVLEEEEV